MEYCNAKPVWFSAINDHTYILIPSDLNSNNTVFGGRVMEIADRVAATVAMRHSRGPCVTLLVDRMKFVAPAYQGEALVFKASVNRVWQSSVEVGLKVYADDLEKEERRHVFSTYFTFVAVDKQGKPRRIRPVIAETDEERRRYREADVRRAKRLEEEKLKKEA